MPKKQQAKVRKVKEICKTCGKRTKYMYRLNEGLFCDKHKDAALLNQKTKLSIEALRDRLQNLSVGILI